MTFAPNLIPGTIESMYNSTPDMLGKNYAKLKGNSPALQVLNLKKIPTSDPNPKPDWYRMVLSDSKHYIQAMLSQTLNPKILSGTITPLCVITLLDFNISIAKGRKILVVGEIGDEVMYPNVKIGEPLNIDPNSSTSSKQSTEASVTAPAPVKQAVVPEPPSIQKISVEKGNLSSPRNKHVADLFGSAAAAPPSKFSKVSSSSSNENPFIDDPSSSTTFNNIDSLSPYNNNWKIKARVTSKGEMKSFTNARGEGKLFSFNLIDSSGEIQVTAFNQVADTFYPIIEVGAVYMISQASVKVGKQQFSQVKNDYQIQLESHSLVTPVIEPAGLSVGIPKMKWNFVALDKISSMSTNSFMDVIAIVKDVGEISSFISKTTQKQMTKREITLVDSSMASVKFTLWAEKAANFALPPGTANPVITIKAAKVGEYNGKCDGLLVMLINVALGMKNLSASIGSTISFNPDIKEAHELRGWYDTIGVSALASKVSHAPATEGANGKEFENMTLHDFMERKQLSNIKEQHLGRSDRPDYFTTVATVLYIKSDGLISYPACPTEGCNKKVIEESPGKWRCEKCTQIFDRCDHRYILSINVADATGTFWLNLFNDSGQVLLGRTAEELLNLKSDNETEFNNVLKEASFKPYIFRVRAKQENYQGEFKVRCNVISMASLTYVQETDFLIEAASKLI